MTTTTAPPKTSQAAAMAILEQGVLRGRTRMVLQRTFLLLFKVIFRLRIEGQENIPKTGAILVVGNHLHNADPLILQVAFPRGLYMMAKKELFEIPVVKHMIRWFGTFPVDRGKSDRSAIRKADALLAAGVAVGMYPEGTRSPHLALQKAFAGAGLLALRGGVQVLPAVITGSERLPFNGARGRIQAGFQMPEPGHRGVLIQFGKPFVIPREENGRRISSEEATDRMMRAIAEMLPEGYRGHYLHERTEAFRK